MDSILIGISILLIGIIAFVYIKLSRKIDTEVLNFNKKLDNFKVDTPNKPILIPKYKPQLPISPTNLNYTNLKTQYDSYVQENENNFDNIYEDEIPENIKNEIDNISNNNDQNFNTDNTLKQNYQFQEDKAEQEQLEDKEEQEEHEDKEEQEDNQETSYYHKENGYELNKTCTWDNILKNNSDTIKEGDIEVIDESGKYIIGHNFEKDVANGLEKDVANGLEKDVANGLEKDEDNGLEKDDDNGLEKDDDNGLEKDDDNGLEKDDDNGLEKDDNGLEKDEVEYKDFSLEEINNLTLKELQCIARKNKLKIKGKKDELIERIKSLYNLNINMK